MKFKFLLFVFSVFAFAESIRVIDIAGREVYIQKKDNKVILERGRQFNAVAPIFGKDGNPFNQIVGWGSDFMKYDNGTYLKYLEKFPNIKNITDMGSPYASDFNIEKAIQLGADVVVVGIGSLLKVQQSGVIDKLDKVGIKVVFIDFKYAPLKNTIPSLMILGKVFNRQNGAYDFIDFYVEQRQKVEAKIRTIKIKKRPKVAIAGSAKAEPIKELGVFGAFSLGNFIDVAGGINYGAMLGTYGNMSLEKVISDSPDIVIGTGIYVPKEYTKSRNTIPLGYSTDAKDAKTALQNIAKTDGWKSIQAIKDGKFYGIYKTFYSSPQHFIALQVFAKWIHSEEFKDLEPLDNFKEFHNRFLPISYSGSFWAEL